MFHPFLLSFSFCWIVEILINDLIPNSVFSSLRFGFTTFFRTTPVSRSTSFGVISRIRFTKPKISTATRTLFLRLLLSRQQSQSFRPSQSFRITIASFTLVPSSRRSQINSFISQINNPLNLFDPFKQRHHTHLFDQRRLSAEEERRRKKKKT